MHFQCNILAILIGVMIELVAKKKKKEKTGLDIAGVLFSEVCLWVVA